MKTVLTKYHGEVLLSELTCIHFSGGIPGLEDFKNYALLPYEDSGFYILQSLEEPSIAFLVVNIFDVVPEYDYTIPQSTIEKLCIEKAEEVLTLGIITPKENFKDSTINLYAPILINQVQHLGKQIFLEQSGYHVRSPLFQKEESKK